MSIENLETGYFFIDYLAYGTNMLTDFIRSEMLTAKDYLSNRFYKVQADCDNSNIQSEKRILSLPELSVRLCKEYLYTDSVFRDGLPIDCKIQRIDFARNYTTKEEAMKNVIGRYEMYFHSDGGETYYFGKRTSPFLERVYYKNDRGVWRYELEFKPRAGRKNNKLAKVNPEILKIWYDICSIMTVKGDDIKTSEDSVPQSRKQYIDFLLECEFVIVSPLVYDSLKSAAEKKYFLNRIKHSDDLKSKWNIIFSLSKNQNDAEN